MSEIISQLNKKGYELSYIDKYLMLLIGTPKRGKIEFNKSSISRIEFLYKLTQAKKYTKNNIVKVTLIPGETLTFFLNQISKKLDLNITKLENYYKESSPYPEAGIYPDTYFLYNGISEKRTISFLLENSNKKYKSIKEKLGFNGTKEEWFRVLIIASIIQKEAGNKEEMPLIASVIFNRLKKRMRLQMDGTLNYGKYSHIKVTPKRIKEDFSHFNTYKYRGLPPSPIGSLTFEAISATLNPAKTTYLYFVRKSKNAHHFSSTYKEHKKHF